MWSVSDVALDPTLCVQSHTPLQHESQGQRGGALPREEATDDRVRDSDGVSKVGLGPPEFCESFSQFPACDCPASSTHPRSIAERQHGVKRQCDKEVTALLAFGQDGGVSVARKMTEASRRLDQAMDQAGIRNDAELARRAKVSTSVISRFRSGERTEQRAKTMEKLAVALGVSSGWLQTGVGGSKPPGPRAPIDQAFATYTFPKGMGLDIVAQIKGKIRVELDGAEEDLPVETIHRRIADLVEEM
jgi:transcriptional regulator with XRE-family HTH domain